MNKNPNPISDFTDEVFEQVEDMGKIAKKQITAKPQSDTSNTSDASNKSDKKVDPVTGKPVPSKKIVTQLNQQVAQLAQMRIKKVREELEKQRLKTSSQQTAASGQPGPEVKQEEKKKEEDSVAKTLKASKSTGEFKGLIGG
ncbi:hypothetical protein HY440_02310 [Candidatus Microgenomates bacterium]|nr:hypothetical protein [Candidatus Microgenomates bacterium]